MIGRLLLESGRLVLKERFGSWTWKLCVPLECLDEQSDSAMRSWSSRQCHFDQLDLNGTVKDKIQWLEELERTGL